jgi:hypothetical protein
VGKTAQLIFNIGPEWSEVRTVLLMANILSRGLLHLRTLHVNTVCCTYIIVQFYIYFLPLQVENKPHEGVTTPAFISWAC